MSSNDAAYREWLIETQARSRGRREAVAACAAEMIHSRDWGSLVEDSFADAAKRLQLKWQDCKPLAEELASKLDAVFNEDVSNETSHTEAVIWGDELEQDDGS